MLSLVLSIEVVKCRKVDEREKTTIETNKQINLEKQATRGVRE